MKYGDLVQFDPITSVVQLTGPADAERMVSSYVISDGMAKQLCSILAPQLDLTSPVEHKGIFIVGNYGSGKSHLMRVISAVAEDATLLDKVHSKDVQEKFKSFAGKFKVIRREIGATQMPLRDIITGYLSEGLAEMGVHVQFQPFSATAENKTALVSMMGAFQEKYPDQGLLFVLDELLDYLRTRDHQALISDLTFLRELAEVCSQTRLRFITGVQEMLFGNPAFQFAADELARINERYVSVRIVRDDIAYVVANRLLQKDESQKSIIRDYVRRFEKVFPDIARRTEEYVNLFPVHPEYLNVFEQVLVGESRMALQTISAAMTPLLDQDVPEDYPGFITYDMYWSTLSSNLALKANPEVRIVFDRVGTILSRIDGSFPQPLYKPLAVRIVDALAVLRLTAPDADSKAGASSAQLRDDLMLYLPNLPEKDPDFLKTTVETVLRQVRTTAGQFVMQNAENGEWYIDVRPGAVDYIARVDERAETLSDDDKDEAFYTVLESALELPDATYRSHFRIWQHELEWEGHKVKRRGYVFLGDPSERSTTQPPLDYYLYFNHAYSRTRVTDDKRPDEVFFTFHGRTQEFDTQLGKFAAASDLASRNSGSDQTEYRGIAEKARRWLVQEVQRKFSSNFDLTWKGEKEALASIPVGSLETVGELVDAAASQKLSRWFDEAFPDYPKFTLLTAPLTKDNMGSACANAIRRLAGFASNEGSAILAGLGLLKGGRVDISESPYATWVQELVNTKPQGKVINRDELLQGVAPEYHIARTRKFNLEPQLLMVVIAALINVKGDLAIVHPLGRFDATNLKDLAGMEPESWTDFKHLERIRTPSPELIRTVLTNLGLAEGLYATDETQAVRQIVEKAAQRAQELATFDPQLASGIACGGLTVYTPQELQPIRSAAATLKALLEKLTHYDTPAKFASLDESKDSIDAAFSVLTEVNRLRQVAGWSTELGVLASYLDAAAAHSTDDSWKESWTGVRSTIAEVLRAGDPASVQLLGQKMQPLKQQYTHWYTQQHAKARLNKTEDKRKQALLEGNTMQRINQLKSVDVLPQQKYRELIQGLDSLRTCTELESKDLDTSPVCPHCGFDPLSPRPAQSLDDLEELAARLLDDWADGLRSQLNDPTVMDHVSLLTPEQQALLKAFTEKGAWPQDMSGFVAAVILALKDVTKVTITTAELVDQVGHNQAMTVEEFTKRVQRLLDQKLAGKDRSTVRIIVE